MTDELVEKVALVLWRESALRGNRDLDQEWREFRDCDRAPYLRKARAAISVVVEECAQKRAVEHDRREQLLDQYYALMDERNVVLTTLMDAREALNAAKRYQKVDYGVIIAQIDAVLGGVDKADERVLWHKVGGKNE